MRCLSADEVEAIFVEPKFTVSLWNDWYRQALVLDAVRASKQKRIAAEQPAAIRKSSYFVRRLNRWLPTNQERLLWIDHWQTGLFGGFENEIVAAAWRGLGESRSLRDAPGIFFEKHNWDEEDQTEVGPSQARALGLLVGAVSTLMITESDGWLVSPGCADRIEFWEGHFFFHSDDQEQLRRANEIVDEFGCARWKS